MDRHVAVGSAPAPFLAEVLAAFSNLPDAGRLCAALSLTSALTFRIDDCRVGVESRPECLEGCLVRCLVGSSPLCTAAAVAQDILNQLAKMAHPVPFVSTRGKALVTTFLGAIREGLATDGGLYVPSGSPVGPHGLPAFWLASLEELAATQQSAGTVVSYHDVALVVLERLVDLRETPLSILARMIQKAYDPSRWSDPSIAPLRFLGSYPTTVTGANGKTDGVDNSTPVYLSEQFHGPTAAFKDFALQLFPQFFARAVQCLARTGDNRGAGGKGDGASNERYMILTATSGDTGVAVINGFQRNAPDIPIMVLYPIHGVSPVQKQQMLACDGGSVHVLGVEADFDFCQSSVKAMFNDPKLAAVLQSGRVGWGGVKMSSANSINWGRLLPQLVYYVYAHVSLRAKDAAQSDVVTGRPHMMDVAVPTGNFGNILACFYAKHYLGVPVRRLVLASNSNDVLHEFVTSGGVYDTTHRRLVTTASPSIDILRASNVERFLYFILQDPTAVANLMLSLEKNGKFVAPPSVANVLQQEFAAGRASENDCAECVRHVLATSVSRTLVDPHTAVALHVVLNEYVPQQNVRASPSQAPTPIVVSSTAHWAKFPEPVLSWIAPPTDHAVPVRLGAEASVGDVAAMYRRITAICPQATLAAPLAQIFGREGCRGEAGKVASVCPADISVVEGRLMGFLAKQGHR